MQLMGTPARSPSFPRRLRVSGGLLLASLALALPLGAQDRGATPEYRGREAMVPMRDGVKLYTQIFEPVGLDEPCPILFTRTPYEVAPLAAQRTPARLGPSPAFARAGYVFVRQDVRGQFRSEGDWQFIQPLRLDPSDAQATDESTDAYDTIAWLLDNVEGHNGRVGMWGISYDAWQTVMALVDAHPALVAASPQASPGDVFVGDDFHHNGAFRLGYTFAWLAIMATGRGDADSATIGPLLQKDGYEFFLGAGSLGDLEERYFAGKVPEWTEVLVHGDYDEYWKRRNVLPHLGDARPAVLHVAGWFDAEDFRGPIDIYQAVERGDDDGNSSLVVGPWKHGGWSAGTLDTGESLGNLAFGEPTSEFFQELIEFPFFEHHLRGGDDPQLPEVLAFETGANLWRDFASWPPPGTEARALHLRAGGSASFDPPAADESPSEFVNDPSRPVPYTAGGAVFPGPEYMVEDQRFVEGRADLLSFLSEPLQEDLLVAGRVEVRLYFSTTGTDADWIVKLIDVYPEETEELSPATGKSLAGARLIVSGDIFRAKYRESFEEPAALEPGVVTELVFSLPDRLHRFRAGHRLEVQVHGTWFPLYDRNPQVYTDIYAATQADFETATLRVYHQEGAASLLRLPILPD